MKSRYQVVSALLLCTAVHATDLLWVDIDGASQNTALIHQSIHQAGGHQTITNSGITLMLTGGFSYEEQLTNSNALLADAAALDGAGATIGLTLSNMPAGTWIVESWHDSVSGATGSIKIDFHKTGDPVQTLVANHNFSSTAASYTIITDGSSTYELLFEENNGNNRSRINGLRIRPSGSTSSPPVTLVNVSPTNTTAASGAPSPFFSTSPTSNGQWYRRTGFGFDSLGNGEIYEKDASGSSGDAAVLETTITGLTPGKSYGIYNAFISPPGNSWGTHMGLTSNDLTRFTPNTPVDLVLDLGLTSVVGSNRNQYLGYLTNATADSSGEIKVYFDDSDVTNDSQRSWLEGLAYGEPFGIQTPTTAPPNDVKEIAPDGAWTWFNDERAIAHQGYIYCGYILSDGRTGITRYDPETEESRHMILSTATSTERADDHNNPSIEVLADGRLFVTYSKHGNDQGFYYRTSKTGITTPSLDSDWNNEVYKSLGAANTYANSFRLSSESNKIYYFSRAINFNPTVTLSTNNGVTFGSPQHFIQTGTGSKRPYVQYLGNGVDRLDFIYTDQHPRNFQNSLYHMYYTAGNFRQTDSTLISSFANLPIDHDLGERGSLVYTYSSSPSSNPDNHIQNGRAWTWDLHYSRDGNQYPVCAFQVRVANAVSSSGPTWKRYRIYYYYARWNGSSWEKKFIAQAGRGIYDAEPDYGGGICIDPEDPRVVYISSNAANPFDLSSLSNVPLNPNGERYEIYRGFTPDNGQTFTWEAVTSNSTVDNLRPCVPKNHGRSESVLWFSGRYTTFLNFDAAVLSRIGSTTTQFSSYASSLGLPGNFTNDEDGDGSTDFVEYALMSDPQTAGGLPLSATTNGIFFPSLGTRNDVEIIVEFSPDLSSGSWTKAATIRADHLPSAAESGFLLEDVSGEPNRLKVTTTAPVLTSGFFRLSISSVSSLTGS